MIRKVIRFFAPAFARSGYKLLGLRQPPRIGTVLPFFAFVVRFEEEVEGW